MPHSDGTILLIDRTRDNAGIFQQLLEQNLEQSYQILIAAYSDPILDLCQSQPLDCILLVSYAPDGRGFELLERLQAQLNNGSPEPVFNHRALPIIVIDDPDINLARRAFKAGAADYLVRDEVTTETLHQVLQSVMRQPSEDSNQICISLQQQLQVTEAALDESRDELEQRSLILDALLSTITDFAYLFDREGRFIFVNQPLLDLWGLSLSEAIGKNFFDLNYPPELAAKHQREIQQVFDTAQSLRDESTYTSPLGVNGIYEYIFTPLLDADGFVKLVAGSTRNITARKRIEAALRESEEKYRALFTSMDEGYVLVDVLMDKHDQIVDLLYIDANPAAVRMTGTELVGKQTRELDPNYEDYWFETAERVAKTGVGERHEFYSTPLKSWYDFYIFKVGAPDTRRVAFIYKDITQHKQAEDELQRSAKLNLFRIALTDALRPLDDPIVMQATACRILGEYCGATRVAYFEMRDGDYVIEHDYTNGATSMVGRYPIDSFGSDLLAILCQGRIAIAPNVAADPHLSSNHHAAFEALQVGAYIGVPLVKQGEFVAGLTVQMAEPRDWTADEIALAEEVAERTWATVERARAEAAIAADLEDMRLLRDLSAQLILEDSIQVLYDKTMMAAVSMMRADAGTLQVMDEATQELVILAIHGFSRTMTDQFHRVSARSGTPCGIALCKGDRTLIDFDVPQSDDPDGSLRLHLDAGYRSGQSTPLIARSGKVIGMVSTHWRTQHRPSNRDLRFLDLLARQVSDLIEQRQADAERNQLLKREQTVRAAAEQANRIKDEFLAILSHELRSPLNPILGWARLLQNGKLDEARRTKALKTIERNAKLQTQLIEDLLDISRIMQGKLSLTVTSVNLSFVIRAAVETVQLAAEAKNIQIILDLPPEVSLISGDPARLQQVVWNLLSNAVKFTPTGGQVTVELRQLNQLAQIRIIDTGKGIHPQFLPYMFEYFRQEDGSTTRQFGGLGLGLAIARQIVEMHGGTVWAQSQGENRGATFTVQLPVTPQAMPIASKSAHIQSDAESLLNNVQILLVDDEPDTREFQAFVLEQSGAKVTAVASGLEALQSLEQSIPDVMVSDVGMEKMDGYMLIQRIRSRPVNQGGSIPAIALTAYAAEVDQQKALQAGFQAYITKPLEPEVLVATIVNLLRN